MRSILWFRNDLRLHDHPALLQAVADGEVLPVYIHTPRQQGGTHFFGFPRLTAHKARFLVESLADLRQALEQRDSTLVYREGRPETVLKQLAEAWGAQQIVVHEEGGTEEQQDVARVMQAVAPLGVTVVSVWGYSLYHPEDLPFDLAHLPEMFTEFRKRVEAGALVRRPLHTPTRLLTPDAPAAGSLPTVEQLTGYAHPLVAEAMERRAQLPAGNVFAGGETAGLARVQQYLWDADLLRRYKDTRNGMLGLDYSSKFSPWLAVGALSPRYVWEQVQQYEQQRVRNDSTYWLVFELLWRDYFRMILHKHSARLFFAEGIQQLPFPWSDDEDLFRAWAQGQTGYPIIDAAMRELIATGFMGNRARQLVASFLTKNLGLDWRMGAEWFEAWLMDYDVSSNYGNWQYAAGVGNDARGFRYFHIPKQAEQYDPQGAYVRYWLPMLAEVPNARIHAPGNVDDYPTPVVDLMTSLKRNERLYSEVLADPRLHKGNFRLQKFVRRSAHDRRRN